MTPHPVGRSVRSVWRTCVWVRGLVILDWLAGWLLPRIHQKKYAQVLACGFSWMGHGALGIYRSPVLHLHIRNICFVPVFLVNELSGRNRPLLREAPCIIYLVCTVVYIYNILYIYHMYMCMVLSSPSIRRL